MNDREKENQPGTPEEEKKGVSPAPDGEDLNRELEQLRDIFQKELDEQTAQAAQESDQPASGEEGTPEDDGEEEHSGISDWDRLITVGDTPVIIEEDSLSEPEDDVAEDEEDDFDEDLCYCCQKNERNRERGEDYPYCEECRESMKHRPVRWYMIPVILFVAAVIALSGYSMRGIVSDYTAQAAAHKLLLEHHPVEGLNAYFELYSQGVSSKPMLKRMLRSLWQFGYIQNVQSILSSEFTSEEIEEDRTLSEINDKLTAFNTTAEAAYNIIGDYETKPASEIPYDDLMNQLTALTESTEESYDSMIVSYYQFYLAKVCGKDVQTQIGYLNQMKDSGSKDYKWLYYPELAKCLGQAGEYDAAFKLCDEILQDNKDDPSAYAAKASLYRRQQNYTAALDEIAKGLEVSASNPELIRQRAIVHLLQGDTANAKTDAETAFNTSATVSTTNTLAVVCHAIGDTAGYNEAVDFLESYSTQLSDRTQAYVDGELTLEQLFLEGSADVA